jgi:hypothetical protein
MSGGFWLDEVPSRTTDATFRLDGAPADLRSPEGLRRKIEDWEPYVVGEAQWCRQARAWRTTKRCSRCRAYHRSNENISSATPKPQWCSDDGNDNDIKKQFQHWRIGVGHP